MASKKALLSLTLPCLELQGRTFKLSDVLASRIESLDYQEIDAVIGPEEWTLEGVRPDIVFAKEAWPHIDPEWRGQIFFTLTALGLGFCFASKTNPTGVAVPEGALFVVDPIELHWLRPDVILSDCWVGVQWAVPLRQASAFANALTGLIGQYAERDRALPVLGL